MKTRKTQYQEFMYMRMRLYGFALRNGIACKTMEVWRSPQRIAECVSAGTGIWTTKHGKSLAEDLQIIKGTGKYRRDMVMADTPENMALYEKLGKFWESIGGVWGGRFKKRYDPYHFEHAEKPL